MVMEISRGFSAVMVVSLQWQRPLRVSSWRWWSPKVFPKVMATPAQLLGDKWVKPGCSMISSSLVVLRGAGALLLRVIRRVWLSILIRESRVMWVMLSVRGVHCWCIPQEMKDLPQPCFGKGSLCSPVWRPSVLPSLFLCHQAA